MFGILIPSAPRHTKRIDSNYKVQGWKDTIDSEVWLIKNLQIFIFLDENKYLSIGYQQALYYLQSLIRGRKKH